MIIVHCKKRKYDVYIGRPSKWGNPFIIGQDGDRKTVVEKFDKWLYTGYNFGNAEATEEARLLILSSLKELEGKKLGCWCSPQLCHGDILIKYVNNYEQK